MSISPEPRHERLGDFLRTMQARLQQPHKAVAALETQLIELFGDRVPGRGV